MTVSPVSGRACSTPALGMTKLLVHPRMRTEEGTEKDVGEELAAEEGADRAEVIPRRSPGRVGGDRHAGRGSRLSATGDGAGQKAALDGGAGRSPGQQPGDEDAPQIHAASFLALPPTPPPACRPHRATIGGGYYRLCDTER